MPPKHSKKTVVARQPSPVIDVSRKVPEPIRLQLCVHAGGRCEFDACNEYLFEHHVTRKYGIFGEVAHIVAFSESGPRASSGPRPADIHDLKNLMLLCPVCHKLIDDNPTEYPREVLETYKENHEREIKYVTGLRPKDKTSLVILKARIGNDAVNFPFDQLIRAIAPRYPKSRDGVHIDLCQLDGNSETFTQSARDAIKRRLQNIFEPGSEVKETGHISLFALAPIPVLAFLGSQLSNKVPMELYQRHRDTEDWKWKVSRKTVRYRFDRLRNGDRGQRAALLLSLSGRITPEQLPADVSAEEPVYEMTLLNQLPAPTFLRTKRDLDTFRVEYQNAIAAIVCDNPGIQAIDLFPAVPAPVAVLCGRELLPKVHPALRIYDKDKHKGGFVYHLTLNQNAN